MERAGDTEPNPNGNGKTHPKTRGRPIFPPSPPPSHAVRDAPPLVLDAANAAALERRHFM